MDRTKYLGGSDVAGVLGISPWRSPYQIWLDKTSPRVEEIDPARQRVLTRGHRLEPYVLDMLRDEVGLKITNRNHRYIDPEHGFLACEIDAEAASGENIEIKTVSPFKAKEWGEQQSDEIPTYYTAQAMHGLMITGRPACIFGVLIGADDFRVYRVDRDDETIAAIRRREISFWQDHVLTGIPPMATTSSDVADMYARDCGETLEADDDLASLIGAIKDARQESKRLDALITDLETRAKATMGECATLIYRGRTIATWKNQSSSRFNQKDFAAVYPELFEKFKQTTESRIFRLK